MNGSSQFHGPHLLGYQRLLLAFAGGVLLVMLIVSACLRPDPRGFGTHQQLGLPPCAFERVLHFPCPSCGMTTSWSHLVRGSITGSWRANAGGAVLGLLALAAGPWAVISACRGRCLWYQPGEWLAVALAVLIVIVTLMDWSLRLALG